MVLISSLIGVGYCTKLYSKDPFKVQVTKVDNGYGYQIYYKEKLFIVQDFIPAVSGKVAFETSEDAELVAEYVVKKLSNNESPTITKEEIGKLLKQKMP